MDGHNFPPNIGNSNPRRHGVKVRKERFKGDPIKHVFHIEVSGYFERAARESGWGR